VSFRLNTNKKSEQLRKRLEHLRKKIDASDRLLLKVLAARMKITVQIGRFKKEHRIPLLQKKRWISLLEKRLQSAKKLGISLDFTEKLFKLIHQDALRLQRQISQEDEDLVVVEVVNRRKKK
jgi:chorismate mutase